MDKENDKVPIPPPLPPQFGEIKSASIALKVRTAPPMWASESHVETPGRDRMTPPAGKYFFYGTLQDPGILREVLDLPDLPVLRSARIVGYKTRLWGQYPAAVRESEAVLMGMMFDVPDEQSARKLADYETKNYRPVPCNIYLDNVNADVKRESINGYVFEYCGNAGDLSDGTFDLDVWLKRMGRRGREQ